MKAKFEEAVSTGDLESVRFLISKMPGEILNCLDDYGRSVLFAAIVNGFSEIVYELCLSGLNVNIHDKNGKTPLHFAAIYKQFDCTKILIDFGAHVNATDVNGNTPLFDAIFNSGGDTNILLLLKSNGADYLSKNKYGVSPKDLADTIGNFDVSYLFD